MQGEGGGLCAFFLRLLQDPMDLGGSFQKKDTRGPGGQGDFKKPAWPDSAAVVSIFDAYNLRLV